MNSPISKFRLTFCVLIITLRALADDFTNELEQASLSLRQANYQDVITHYTRALQIQSNSSQGFTIYLSRGWAYEKVSQSEKSFEDFGRAIGVATNPKDLASGHYVRGLTYLARTNPAEAFQDFTSAIQFDANLQGAYVQRARIHLELGHFENAIADCDFATSLKTNDTVAFYYKGLAYEYRHDFANEVIAYTDALRFSTNFQSNAKIFYSRGIAFAQLDQLSNAVLDFNRTIQLEPTIADAYAIRGLMWSQLGDYRMGKTDCEKSVQLNTNCSVACNNLAWILSTAPQSGLRDGKLAIKYATHACNLTAWKEPHCLGTLAAACAENHQFSDAIKWEKMCIQIGFQTEKEIIQAQKELELFKQRKPFHFENKH